MEIKLNYIEKGEGIPLVLLHGNGENSEYFSEQINYFSPYFRVIAVDTRGHGKSPRGTKSFTIEQFADDLKDFLDEMKLKDIYLLGFSDGANIALLFTIKFPGYVKKLVLDAPNLNPSGIKKKFLEPMLIKYKSTALLAAFSKKEKIKEEMLSLMVNQPDIRLEKVENINIPTLLVLGTKDMIDQAHVEMIHRHIKNSELRLIEGDHFIIYNLSHPFNRHVHIFLDKNAQCM